MATALQKAKDLWQSITGPKLISAQPENTAGWISPLQQIRNKTLSFAAPIAQKYNQFASTPITNTSPFAVRTAAAALENFQPTTKAIGQFAKATTAIPLNIAGNVAMALNQPKIAEPIYQKALDIRKQTGYEQPGLKTFGKGVSATGRAVTTLAALTNPLAAISPMAISGAIGAGISAINKQDVARGLGTGLSEGFKMAGLSPFTNYFTKILATKPIALGGSKIINQLNSRLTSGALNAGESFIFNKLNEVPVKAQDYVLPFLIGMAANSPANKALFEKTPTGTVEIYQDALGKWHNQKGQFAKAVGVKPENLDKMIPSLDGRTFVLKSRLDEKYPGILSDLEKMNKFLEDKTNGFGSIVKSVNASEDDIKAALKSGDITKTEADLLLNKIKTQPVLNERISPQLATQATLKTDIQEPGITQKIKVGGKQLAGKTIPSQGPIIDPVQKITEALKKAVPLEKQQGKIYSQIRSRQAGALAGIGEQMGGEAGYYKKLGQLKGEMPKVQFESIRKSVTQNDINEIFNRVEKSNLSVFEKVSAQGALKKLLGAEGGSVPTKGEIALLNEVFPPEFIQAVLDNRSGFQRAISEVEGFLNVPRAIMASADLSAPMRQGIFLIGRPKQFVPAFKDMFKYAFSEKAYDGLQESIKADPNYKLMREAKLGVTDMSPVLSAREEAFMSKLPEKLPLFGGIVKGSNRAYSGFLTKLRADTFNDLVKTAKSQGVDLTPEVIENIGSFVNSATGRGNLGATLSKAAPILNATFFSPRLMASRINLLNPVYYSKLDPFTRKEALKSLLTFAGTTGTILGLSKLAGAEVGVDPRSADFGKIKVGNTRFDLSGGFNQYIKLAAQLATGQVVSTTTGKVVTLGEGYKPLTRKDIIQRFFENKTSPVASFVIGLLTGQSSLGDKFNVPAELINRFVPIIAQDIYDLQKEYGPLGFGAAIPGIFGIGSQTYGKQELVSGENQFGQKTLQIREPKGLNEVIYEKVVGKQPLGTTAQYNVDAYYKQLLKLPVEERRRQIELIINTDPELAKKLAQSAKDVAIGMTPNDQTLKAKGIASGDRANAIVKELRRAKNTEAKRKLINDYINKGILTPEVAKQISILLSK